MSLSKHLSHNLGNLLVLGKIGVFHNRRNASSFFFSSRRRHTRCSRDWSSDVCSSDLPPAIGTVIDDFKLPDFDGKEHSLNSLKGAKGTEIGRASCRKECRSRWSPYH